MMVLCFCRGRGTVDVNLNRLHKVDVTCSKGHIVLIPLTTVA